MFVLILYISIVNIELNEVLKDEMSGDGIQQVSRLSPHVNLPRALFPSFAALSYDSISRHERMHQNLRSCS